MTIVLFSVYILSSVFVIRAFSIKNFVSLLRLAIIPIASGVAWLLSTNGAFVTSETFTTLMFGALTVPLLFVMLSVALVSVELYRNSDRKSILRHIAFNTPYETKTA